MNRWSCHHNENHGAVVDVVVTGWNLSNAEGKRRPPGEVTFFIHPHKTQYGFVEEQPRSSQVSILISDGTAAIANLFLRVNTDPAFDQGAGSSG